MTTQRKDITALINQAVETFTRLPPDIQAHHWRMQRRSWVIGELMLSNPDMTRDEAVHIVDKADGLR